MLWTPCPKRELRELITKKFNVFEETESFKPFEENGEISEDFSNFLKKISELATSFFQQFLPGAPKIVFATNRQEHWVSPVS